MTRSRRARSNHRRFRKAIYRDRLLSTIGSREMVRQMLDHMEKPLLSEGSVVINLCKELAICQERDLNKPCCFMASTQAQEAGHGADVMALLPLRSTDIQFKAAHPEGSGLKYLLNDSQNGLQHVILRTRENAGQDVLYVFPLFFYETHLAWGDSRLWAMTLTVRPQQIPTAPNPLAPFWLHLQLDSWTWYATQGLWKSLPETIPPDWVNRLFFQVKPLDIDLARSLPWKWENLTCQTADIQNPLPSTPASFNQSTFPQIQNQLELYTAQREACAVEYWKEVDNFSWSWPSLLRMAISGVVCQVYDDLIRKEKNRRERQKTLGLLIQLRRRKEIQGLWPKLVPLLLKNTLN